MDQQLRIDALQYYRLPVSGKIPVMPSKQMMTQRDLALAYSPVGAAVCDAIVEDPNSRRNLTARGNLVAVITNGTAVLGLGAIGPLAAMPVMEGKGGLFKKIAGIDVFDLEIDEQDSDKLVDIIAGAAPLNGLKVVGKDIKQIKLVAAGAAAPAYMLVSSGVCPENIIVTDIKEVVYRGRLAEMDENKGRYAVNLSASTLSASHHRCGCVSGFFGRRRVEA